MEHTTRGALSGVRVIDFGQYIAGPLVAQMLADYGADVIRVDPPGGPMWKSNANAYLQRGKRSIVLDLKQEPDLDIARRLVASADVVIENFRPGVMDRLGLGSQELLERHPELVYCSIPGFASDDPRARVYANEGVVAAAAGLYPSHNFDPDGEPVVNTLPLASVSAAMIAANCVAAALIARERGGFGQRVEVSLFDATYELTRLYNDAPPGGTKPPRQMGGTGSFPIARSYECQDGRWVRVSWLEGRQLEDFARIVGKYEEWDGLGLLNHAMLDFVTDADLSDRTRDAVSEAFKSKPAAYWERVVGPVADLAVIRSTEDWLLYDEQALAIAASIVRVDPDLGMTHQGGSPVTLTVTPADPGVRHPLDSDREDILTELGRLPQKAAVGPAGQAVKLSSALEGIRTVDMTVLLAGPTAARLLGEYGAEVVHIGNPNWKGMDHWHYQVHIGKRTMLLDLKKPEAGEVFRKLVQDADIISTNFSQEVARRLKVDETSVRTYNPDVIYSRISAHGIAGPRAEYRGHEEIGQAVTGALQRFGKSPEGNMHFFVINDDGTGHVAAFGILMALFHRIRTGVGQFVGTSLAQTCVLWQAPYMIAYSGKDWDEPGGLDFRGYGPLERVYQGSDRRWFFLAVEPSAGAEALAGIEGLEAIDKSDPDALQSDLTERFALEPAQTWIDRINALDNVGAGLQATMGEVAKDSWALTHGLYQDVDFPLAGRGTIVGPAPRLSRTPMKLGAPIGPPGNDSRGILADLGFADSTDHLIETSVVSETPLPLEQND
ncbi:CoA transferase [Streptomyces sp. NPDC048002]|uniref:CaiB/BaiF CoA-transferase family protein n=1 Tax=Streptomyces sp. NPDC048002 TaxID=3154344 RepID=UPI0033D55301